MREPGQPTFETHTYHLDALMLALRNGAQIPADKKAELLKLLQQKPQELKTTKQPKTEAPARSAVQAALSEMDLYVNAGSKGRPVFSPEIGTIKGSPHLLAQANVALTDKTLLILYTSNDIGEIERSLEYFTQMNKGFATFPSNIPGISAEKEIEMQEAMAKICRRYLHDEFLKTKYGMRFIYSLILHTRQSRNEIYNDLSQRDFDKLFVEVRERIESPNPHMRNEKIDNENYAKYKKGIDVFLRSKYGV